LARPERGDRRAAPALKDQQNFTCCDGNSYHLL